MPVSSTKYHYALSHASCFLSCFCLKASLTTEPSRLRTTPALHLSTHTMRSKIRATFTAFSYSPIVMNTTLKMMCLLLISKSLLTFMVRFVMSFCGDNRLRTFSSCSNNRIVAYQQDQRAMLTTLLQPPLKAVKQAFQLERTWICPLMIWWPAQVRV